MVQKAKLSEADLAVKFIDYFNDGYEIYKEVPAYGIIDFVATDGKIQIAVEVKLSLNIDVIEQAHKNLNYCNFSYVAVPKANGRHFAYKICQQYGIGVIEYYSQHYGDRLFEEVTEVVKPKFIRPDKNWFQLKLKDYMKESVAGSKNNRITAFGNTVRTIKRMLTEHNGSMSVKDVFKEAFHYNKISSAKACIYTMCRRGVITDFFFEDGFIKLNNNPTVQVSDTN